MRAGNPNNKNIAVSAALNIVRQACMIAFPLITYSYATRILGTGGIGIYEFAQSIISYFALIAALGIANYAVRDGAKYIKQVKESGKASEKLNDFVSEVFSINIVMTVIAYCILAGAVCLIPLLRNYSVVIMIMSLSILFTTLSMDWVNSLFEDYLYLTIRYVAVQLVAILGLVVFVRTESDLYKYAAISIFGVVATGTMNFVYIRRFVKFRFTFKMNLAKHMIPIFILFCNNIASVVYLNSDVTILRILTDENTVGLYGVASKIYTMIKSLMNAAIFVIIPRFSMYVSQGDNEEARQKYKDGLKNLLAPLMAVLAPSCVGLYFLAEDVIRIVAGEKFVGGADALKILSVALLFAVMACFMAYAIIMPYKLEKYFLISTSVAALVNIMLNFAIIPVIGLNAAAWTTLLAEVMVFVFLAATAYKKVKLSEIVALKDMVSVALGSIAVGIGCMAIGVIHVPGSFIIKTVITIVVSVCVYAFVIVICKNSVVGMILNYKKARGTNK